MSSVHPLKLGVCKARHALVLMYTDEKAKLRQRLMPVRNLDRIGALAAAHGLIHAHAVLQDVDFEQVPGSQCTHAVKLT